MLTQIRNLACQLKRQNAEIEFAIHRNRADKLERTASWNRADKLERQWHISCKQLTVYETHLSRTPSEPVEKSNSLRSSEVGTSSKRYALRAALQGGSTLAMTKDEKVVCPKTPQRCKEPRLAERSKRSMCERPHLQNTTCEPTSLGVPDYGEIITLCAEAVPAEIKLKRYPLKSSCNP